MRQLWHDGLLTFLRVAAVIGSGYLFLCETLPNAARHLLQPSQPCWPPVLLAALSCIVAVLSAAGGGDGDGRPTGSLDQAAAASMMALLNALPIIASVTATLVSPECSDAGRDCDLGATVLDAMGLVSARLARLDLCGSLLLCVHGQSAWMLGATGSRIGDAEAMPLHRAAGWWCMMQSTLHSVCYILFYLRSGGLRSLWVDCLPMARGDGELNRLGLINGFGVLTLLFAFGLTLPSLPRVRRRCYSAFQLLHLPTVAMFAVGCFLHDFPILLFAIPGFATWYAGRRYRLLHGGFCPSRRFPAKLCMLPGTSAPWLALTIRSRCRCETRGLAKRGQWASVRVVSLGREAHPLSIAHIASAGSITEYTFIISTRAGDWSKALGDALSAQTAATDLEVEMAGPFPFGGGSWSLHDSWSCRKRGTDSIGTQATLLLIAGGTGVTGWLPGLALTGRAGRRCHLVWCVRSEADYRSLAHWLPATDINIEVTVFVSRPDGLTHEAPPFEAGAAACADFVTGMPLHDIHSRLHVVLRAAAVLSSTLVGLLVGYVCLRRIVAQTLYTSAMTLAGYTLMHRVLPIVLTAAATAATVEVSFNVLGLCTAAGTRSAPQPHRTQPLSLMSDSEPCAQIDSSAATLPQPVPVDLVYGPSLGGDAGALCNHSFREGRPNLDEVVRSDAAGTNSRWLVVAACGPATLVQAARKACANVSKEIIKDAGNDSVRIVFSGSESSW